MKRLQWLMLGVFTVALGCAAGSGEEGAGGQQATSASSTTGAGGTAGGGMGGGGMGGGMGGMGGSAVCGDGLVAAGEECDDANGNASDRCADCQVQCLSGEHEFSGNHHCYADFAAQKINYAGALDACLLKGGHLVSITSQGEQDFVFDTVIDKAVDLPRWLGLTDVDTEGTFAWESGEPQGYTHWIAGQPDDFQATEDCVEMYQVTGEWNDDNCTYEYEYVCEYVPPGLP